MSKLDDTFELLEEDVPRAPKRQRPKIPVWMLLVVLLVGAGGAYAFYGKNLPGRNTVAVVQTPDPPPAQPPAPVTEPPPAPPPPPPTKEVPTPVNIIVNFDRGSHVIRTDEFAQLGELAALIRDNPGTMKMSAYTDNEGSVESGEWLSQQRAAAMVKFFESQGVHGNIKYDINAYGELYPRADNSTEEGRAQNRRVEIYFVPDAWAARAQ